jgi:glucose-6-phosphate dehydrogenase assembly protein OpcA
VLLRARERSMDRLPFAVRSLLIGDLPTNLWWASPEPPPLAGPLLYDLAESAQQLVYDSQGWIDPHRGVAATSSWLTRFERQPGQGRWRVASDLNWRRLKFWRRLLAQALDPSSEPGAAESITDVLVEHGPHAVTQAWELVGWLAARLSWRVQAARVQPGVEMSWQVTTPHGSLHLRIVRLPEGPSEVRRVRIACMLGGKAGALNCLIEEGHRLAAVPEGVPGAARTVNFQEQTLAQLVSRQLSDREPDPVFRESMAVAQVFAQSVLT